MLAQPNSPAFYSCIKRLMLPNENFLPTAQNCYILSADVCFTSYGGKYGNERTFFIISHMKMPLCAEKYALQNAEVIIEISDEFKCFCWSNMMNLHFRIFPTWKQFHELFRNVVNIIVERNVRESRFKRSSKPVWVICCNIFFFSPKQNASKNHTVDLITNLGSVLKSTKRCEVFSGKYAIEKQVCCKLVTRYKKPEIPPKEAKN